MTTTQRSDEQRRILEMVAAGDITPTEAARLIEALSGSEPPEIQPKDYSDPAIIGIKVIGTFKTIQIQGDPTVTGAVAEGDHRVRTENGRLIFEEDLDNDQPGYVLFGPRSRRFRFSGKINGRTIQVGEGPDVPPVLAIKMNPSLPLEIEMTAGTVKVGGVDGPIEAAITAGSGRFEDVKAPISASVDAGSLHVRGVFDRGNSSIRCTAGKVKVELEPGSDVRLRAKATLGRVSLPGGQPEGSARDWTAIGGINHEMVIGDGSGTLDIEATTGSVSVTEVS